jgi:hypothetical protein
LTSKAIIVAVGITWWSSSSRFGPISIFKAVMPVVAAGRFNQDKPHFDRVAPYPEDNRNSCGASPPLPKELRRNHVHAAGTSSAPEQAIDRNDHPPGDTDRHILASTYLPLQSQLDCAQPFRVQIGRCAAENPSPLPVAAHAPLAAVAARRVIRSLAPLHVSPEATSHARLKG